jgi:hypothetical protein
MSERAYNVQGAKSSIASSVSTLSPEVKEVTVKDTVDAGKFASEQHMQQEDMLNERKVEIETTSVSSDSESLPTTSTASTSTSEHRNVSDDSALIEQFQQLVKEFQDIIQNNPQLVALAGNIMTKVISVPKSCTT